MYVRLQLPDRYPIRLRVFISLSRFQTQEKVLESVTC